MGIFNRFDLDLAHCTAITFQEEDGANLNGTKRCICILRQTGLQDLAHVNAVEFPRVREASQLWSVQVNILEVRADSGFYRVLRKLLVMHTAASCQGYSVLLAQLYLGIAYIQD